MRLALAQLDALVGDLVGNGERILNACRRAAGAGARLVLTPELSLWGYPPRDLLLRPSLLEAQTRALESLAAAMPAATGVLVGMAEPIPGTERPALHNAVALVEAGGWRVVGRKRLLPSYDVFDERRYFRPAEAPSVLELGSDGRTWRLGLTICEDLWVEEELQGHRLAGADPIADLQAQRLDLLLNLSASPFGQGKAALRRRLAARAATRLGVPVVYVNQVGGNDELVFDGAGFVVDAAGAVVLQQAWSAEDLSVWDPAASQGTADRSLPAESAAPLAPQGSPTIPPAPGWSLLSLAEPEASEQLLRALVLGVRDYARKCGFGGALLGLSGGIDSALVAVIACAALGAERVRALRMPSPWSSEGSLTDAADLAARLGLALGTLPIAPLMEAMEGALTPALGGPPAGLTAENLQSRLRGTLLMAVANQEGQLLLSTGNKSELAVGYCTLYGDMNGGLAVIGDLYKTTVFRLCAWLDAPESAACRAALGLPAAGELIGAAIRTKPPSAELRPDQRDSDSLPDYAVLDPILKALVEELASPEQLVAAGADAALVERVANLLRRAEFKRRQAPPALKVSGRAFGSGWRFPIAAGG
ncbi:NAD+ synthase [Vulcanococcus limneticus]|jgi:NAD+ synthase (glutamine-hydrolysing)|uniref:NAD+ synthase n=1 Tax=Vulcanococcus limneticus TaxID=2170428 RepID=UPI00398BF932